MSDPFAAPEGLRNVPLGLWPSPEDQTLDCGHSVDEGDLIGRIDGDLGCEDCVTDHWDGEAWYNQACRCGEPGHCGPF